MKGKGKIGGVSYAGVGSIQRGATVHVKYMGGAWLASVIKEKKKGCKSVERSTRKKERN